MEKLKKWVLISLIISLISILILVMATIKPTTLLCLTQIKPIYLVTAVVFHITSFFIWGARMKIMSKALGCNISFISSLEIVASNLFVAAITPSMAGGEPVRIYGLHHRGMPYGNATAVVLGERILDALLILLAIPIALYIFKDFLPKKYGFIFMATAIGIFISIILLVYAMCYPESIKNIFRKIGKKISKIINPKKSQKIQKIILNIDTEIENFHKSLWTFLREGWYGLFLGAICTIAFWTIELMLPSLILLGLNSDAAILHSFASQIILIMFMIIPITPGASGIAELGAKTLFSLFVNSSVIGILILAWRALTYYMNLLIGGIVSIKLLHDIDLIKEVINKF